MSKAVDKNKSETAWERSTQSNENWVQREGKEEQEKVKDGGEKKEKKMQYREKQSLLEKKNLGATL